MGIIALAQIQMSFNVSALPVSIGGIVADFQTTPSSVGTALVVYSLPVAGFVTLGAKIGKLIGSRLAFQVGALVHGLAMLGMAVSSRTAMMIQMQALAGVGAALLSHAVMSIGAVKGIQFGSGFACAAMRGSECNDQRTSEGFLSNHAGGILGGISSGQEIVLQAAIKPTSSISRVQQTVNKNNETTSLVVEGRHDPCICPRAVVVVEAMVAITLLDLYYTAFGRT